MRSLISKIFVPASILVFVSVRVYCDDLTFSAAIDRAAVSAGESINLQVTVSGSASNIPNPEFPALPDFNVYSSGRSQNISFVNGRVSSSVTFNYMLSPKSAGKFQIPPIKLSYGGKVYSTNPLNIEVVSGSSSTQAQSPGQGSRQNVQVDPGQTQQVFVQALIDKDEAYVNEPVTFTFRLFSAVRLMSNPEYNPPSFQGFFTEDLPPQKNYQTVINNVTYAVNEIKLMLFPQSPGALTISPGTIRTSVPDSSGRGTDPFGFPDDFFSGFFSRGRPVELKSKALTLKVKPLPLPKPDSFTGAVGKFNLSSSADRKEAAANEPVTYSVTVSGSGNIKMLGDVKPPDIPGARRYDTISSHDITKKDYIVSGRKVFKTVFVPEVSGVFRIPPAVYSYFDPASGSYRTLKTQELSVNVTPAAKKASSAMSGIPAPLFDSKGVVQVGQDIRFLKQSFRPYGRTRKLPLVSNIILFLSGLIFLSSLILVKYTHYSSLYFLDILSVRAFSVFKKEISRISGDISGRDFYSAVSAGLIRYIAKKTKKSIQGLTYPEMEKVLVLNFPVEAVLEIIARLKEMDEIRYSQEAVGRTERAEKKASIIEWLRGIDRRFVKNKSSRRPGRDKSSRLVSIFFLLVFSSLIAARISADNDEESFRLAVEEYKSGNYLSSGERFRKLLEQYPQSPELLYNAGCVFYRLGTAGKSLYHFALAQEYSPADGDVKYNIDIVSAAINDPDWKAGFIESLDVELIKFLLSLSLLYLSLILSYRFRNRGNPLFWNTLASVMLSVVFLSVFAVRYAETRGKNGVCLFRDMGLRSGPSDEFPVNHTIPEGKRLKILSESGHWLETGIKSSGATGWIEKKYIGVF